MLKQVVIMGGSIRTMTDPYGVAAPIAPHPEWNIKNDIAGAKKLFDSGVPLQVMPLDSTANLKMQRSGAHRPVRPWQHADQHPGRALL